MNLLSNFIFLATLILSQQQFAYAVNINTADAETLTKELIGIGENKAKAIVKYREDNGPYHSIEDLASVKGIGPKLLEKNLNKIETTESS